MVKKKEQRHEPPRVESEVVTTPDSIDLIANAVAGTLPVAFQVPHATAQEIHDEFNLGVEAAAKHCEDSGRPAVAAEIRKLKQA